MVIRWSQREECDCNHLRGDEHRWQPLVSLVARSETLRPVNQGAMKKIDAGSSRSVSSDWLSC